MFNTRARVRAAFAALIAVGVLAFGVLPASAATTKDKPNSSTSASAKPAGTNQSHGKKAKHGHKGKKHQGASKSDKTSKPAGHATKPGKKGDHQAAAKKTKSSKKADKATGKRLSGTCKATKTPAVLNAAHDAVTTTVTVKGCKGPQTLSSISHWYDLPTFLKDSCKVAKGQCGVYKPGTFDMTVTNGTYVLVSKVPPHCFYQVDYELNGHFFGSAHGGDHNCKGTTSGGGTGGGSNSGSGSGGGNTNTSSSSSGGLAFTGINLFEVLKWVVGLIGSGVLLLWATRRRQNEDEAVPVTA